jgi:hypothetical protein
MNPSRKLVTSAGLFALSLLLVTGAAAAQSVAPLFVAWIPLVLVAWVLTRPGPDWEPLPATQTGAEEGAPSVLDDSTPSKDEGTS